MKLVVLPQTTPTGEVKASSWTGTAMDMAESGIVVRVSGAAKDTFQAEGEVRLEIELPDPWGEIRTLGKIHRVKPALSDEKIVMVGIEFSSMAEPDTRSLKEYLSGEDDL